MAGGMMRDRRSFTHCLANRLQNGMWGGEEGGGEVYRRSMGGKKEGNERWKDSWWMRCNILGMYIIHFHRASWNMCGMSARVRDTNTEISCCAPWISVQITDTLPEVITETKLIHFSEFLTSTTYTCTIWKSTKVRALNTACTAWKDHA